jgi:hypothetical protein
MSIQEKIPQPSFSPTFGLAFNESTIHVKGRVTITLKKEGREDVVFEKDNIYTLDGGVLASMMFSGINRSLNMLAVGTSANGSSSNPDIPDSRQRKLNAELFRKEFSSVVFRDENGNISAVPTNVVDFTTTFSGAEANGALNEMGLLSAVDVNQPANNTDNYPNRDTTLDLNNFDVLVNYLTFPVINKPNGSILAITWRLTF